MRNGSGTPLTLFHSVAPTFASGSGDQRGTEVLAEPEVAGAEAIVVTGDHAAGPQPVAVLDRLTALGNRVVLVRGNADRELVALAEGRPSTVGEPYEIDMWAAKQLSPEHVALLAGLPHPVTST